MARGTQHLRKRPQPDARALRQGRKGRRRPNELEATLFFERLRRGAKWMFVFLALVFGLGFVLFGVGSGSTGIGDVLRDNLGFLNIGGSSGPSIGALQKKTREHPKDAKAFGELAEALQTDRRLDEAIAALERYTALRPNDQEKLQELAGLYDRRGDELQQEADTIQANAPLVSSSNVTPPANTPFGKIYQDPNGLADPIERAVTTLVSQQAGEVYQKVTAVREKEIGAYRKLASANPKDAQLQLQLGFAAIDANDLQTALVAFRRFLGLAPDDQEAPRIRQIVKQLKAQSAPTVSTG